MIHSMIQRERRDKRRQQQTRRASRRETRVGRRKETHSPPAEVAGRRSAHQREQCSEERLRALCTIIRTLQPEDCLVRREGNRSTKRRTRQPRHSPAADLQPPRSTGRAARLFPLHVDSCPRPSSAVVSFP